MLRKKPTLAQEQATSSTAKQNNIKSQPGCQNNGTWFILHQKPARALFLKYMDIITKGLGQFTCKAITS